MSNEKDEKSARLEEFKALRDEILKRIDTRERILQANLVLLAAVLTIAIQTEETSVLFVYPPIVVILTIIWAENELNIRFLVIYIRKELEYKLDGLGWERWAEKRRKTSLRPFLYSIKSYYILFIIGQVITFALGYLMVAETQAAHSQFNDYLIIIGICSIMAEFIVGLALNKIAKRRIPEDYY